MHHPAIWLAKSGLKLRDVVTHEAPVESTRAVSRVAVADPTGNTGGKVSAVDQRAAEQWHQPPAKKQKLKMANIANGRYATSRNGHTIARPTTQGLAPTRSTARGAATIAH